MSTERPDIDLLASVMTKILHAIRDGEYGGTGHDLEDLPRFYVETGITITEDELAELDKVLHA